MCSLVFDLSCILKKTCVSNPKKESQKAHVREKKKKTNNHRQGECVTLRCNGSLDSKGIGEPDSMTPLKKKGVSSELEIKI